MSNIIIFVPKDGHSWGSLNFISHNIVQSLKETSLKIEYLQIEQDILGQQQLTQLEKLTKEEQITLYFLYDNLNFEGICAQIASFRIYRYIFPVYGNLTLEIDRWKKLEKLLTGKPVTLLTASSRSSEQIRLLTKEADIQLIPYPVEADYNDKSEQNSKLKIIYAGRIAQEKNVVDLLHIFSKALEHRLDIELHLAGGYHDKVLLTHGLNLAVSKLKEQCDQYFQKYSDRIFYHGQLTQTELLELYSKMDIYISCSTHHDEDFGISAAQAQLMGLKLILSDWGGHSDFEGAQLIPVSVNARNVPEINHMVLLKTLLGLVKVTKNSPPQNIIERTSFTHFAHRFEEITSAKTKSFEGLSPLFHELAQISLTSYPFHATLAGSRELYLAIYTSYLRDLSPSKI